MLTFFLTGPLLYAQEHTACKWSLIGYGGIGYGVVKNDNQPDYNLNSNNGAFLLNYRLNEELGLASGIGVNELTGNAFNELGNFYHERTLLKVPLLLTINSELSAGFRIIGNLGFYGQNIIKDAYRFQTSIQEDIYSGWNFGAEFGLGFIFPVLDRISAGINYQGQSDFSKFESTDNAGISDKQKLQSLNSVGLLLIFTL